jgi:kynurenine formamidase
MHGGRHQDLTHVFTAGFPVLWAMHPRVARSTRSRRTASTARSGRSASTPALIWTRLVTSEAFKNPGPDGKFHFPGWGADAVQWLLERRHITGIGVDTMSLDPGVSATFDAHKTLLAADRYGLENIANLRDIPARGAQVTVGVIPGRRAREAPAGSWRPTSTS